ncbi:MAG: hypothetical protein HQL14_06520 [Candidatus Omnitrophica bacterium]|nr:hypothetical protein [Candidatus Omnitrophota bacterium]
MISKIVAFSIVLPLLIVPFFCSCVQKVEAASVGVEHCPDDDGDAQSAKHDDSKADHHSHFCNCIHTLFANITTFRLNLSFVHNGFSEIKFEEPVFALKTSINFAYLGPPLGILSEVPLYIQQHSLRI